MKKYSTGDRPTWLARETLMRGCQIQEHSSITYFVVWSRITAYSIPGGTLVGGSKVKHSSRCKVVAMPSDKGTSRAICPYKISLRECSMSILKIHLSLSSNHFVSKPQPPKKADWYEWKTHQKWINVWHLPIPVFQFAVNWFNDNLLELAGGDVSLPDLNP